MEQLALWVGGEVWQEAVVARLRALRALPYRISP